MLHIEIKSQISALVTQHEIKNITTNVTDVYPQNILHHSTQPISSQYSHSPSTSTSSN